MRSHLFFGSLVLLGLSFFQPPLARAAAPQWGNLSGSFKFIGEAEAPKQLTITRDNECCDKYQGEIVDQTLLLGKDNALTNVFIWLKVGRRDDPPAVHPDYEEPDSMEVLIENKHCMFYPHAAAIWSGKQTLKITNEDPIAQAAKIDTFSNAPLNATIPIDGEIKHKFELGEPLPLPILCGVHPWESAQLLIHTNPYFAVSDKTGKFTIKNIPAGEWEFIVWHEKTGYLEAKEDWRRGRFKIEIKPGENDLGTIECNEALFAE